ncbi:MAG: hypothetical protein ACRDZT_01660 [Acidimicrobiales bacterium]
MGEVDGRYLQRTQSWHHFQIDGGLVAPDVGDETFLDEESDGLHHDA